jgi:hypothetical protein
MVFIVMQAILAAIAQGQLVQITGVDGGGRPILSPREQWRVDSLRVEEVATDSIHSKQADGKVEFKNSADDLFKTRGRVTVSVLGRSVYAARSDQVHPHVSNAPKELKIHGTTTSGDRDFGQEVIGAIAAEGTVIGFDATVTRADGTSFNGQVFVIRTDVFRTTALLVADEGDLIWGVNLTKLTFE